MYSITRRARIRRCRSVSSGMWPVSSLVPRVLTKSIPRSERGPRRLTVLNEADRLHGARDDHAAFVSELEREADVDAAELEERAAERAAVEPHAGPVREEQSAGQ